MYVQRCKTTRTRSNQACFTLTYSYTHISSKEVAPAKLPDSRLRELPLADLLHGDERTVTRLVEIVVASYSFKLIWCCGLAMLM